MATASRWDQGPPYEEYPPDAGVKARQLDGPVQRPGREPADMTATRKDGTAVSIRASLGLPSVPAADDDQGVTWEQVTP